MNNAETPPATPDSSNSGQAPSSQSSEPALPSASASPPPKSTSNTFENNGSMHTQNVNVGSPVDELLKVFDAGRDAGRKEAIGQGVAAEQRNNYDIGGVRTRHTSTTTSLAVVQKTPANEAEYSLQFAALSNEDKLFVVLLRLFPNISWVDFWEIYDQALRKLLPAKQFERKSSTEEDLQQGSEKDPPRFRSEEYWLRVAHAEISLTTTEYIEGSVCKTTIDFVAGEGEHKGVTRKIIEGYLSSHQRSWLFRVEPILYALGSHPYVVIRRMAAEAAAVLAGIDFDSVRRKIFEPWSLDESSETRAAVAYGLDLLIRNKTNDAAVVLLLGRWSNPQSNFSWRQCWTAAACYKLIGQHRFDLAQKDLKLLNTIADKIISKYQYLANSEISEIDQDLLEELPDAITYTLVTLAIEGKVQEVLAMFEGWLQEKNAVKGYSFANLTVLSSLEGISDATLSLKKQKVPIKSDFFELIKDKEFRKCLAQILVMLTKISPETRKYVTNILAEWVIQLNQLNLSTEPIGKIIVNMFRRFDPNHRERLLQTIKRWIGDKRNALRYLATDVYQKLIGSHYPLPDSNDNSPVVSPRISFGTSD